MDPSWTDGAGDAGSGAGDYDGATTEAQPLPALIQVAVEVEEAAAEAAAVATASLDRRACWRRRRPPPRPPAGRRRCRLWTSRQLVVA